MAITIVEVTQTILELLQGQATLTARIASLEAELSEAHRHEKSLEVQLADTHTYAKGVHAELAKADALTQTLQAQLAHARS